MTWSPNASFAALVDDREREELFAVEVSGHATVFTTGPVTSASWSYVQTLAVGSIEGGAVDIAAGTWQLGALEFSLIDRSGTARALAAVTDLAGRTVSLWMGFRGLAQANWEKIGTYTIETCSIGEKGRYDFRCIEPFPQLGRALADSLGSGIRKTITQPAVVGSTRIYVEDRDDLEIGMTVVLYDNSRYTIGTISSIGTEYSAGTPTYFVDLSSGTDVFVAVNGTLARCLSLRGNPVNIAVRILVDDFALAGSIQTDFPLDAADGAWTTGDGFGVPLANLDTAAIKTERDARMSTLSGQVILERRIESGRSWFDTICHGLMQMIVRRSGLLSVRSCLIPSAAGVSPLTIDSSNAQDWQWERSFVDAANRVIVEGDVLGDVARQLSVAEDAASIAAIGRRELIVTSPWLRTALNGEQHALIIGGRLLARTTSGVETVSCRASVGRSAVEPGDVVYLTHPFLPDTGGTGAMSGAVAEVAEASLSHAENGLSVTVRRYPYARGAAITPDGQVAYGSASSGEKAQYAFICQDDGLMPDSTPGYTWV